MHSRPNEEDARAYRRAFLWLPLLLGLASLALGQDSNWDLRNYHLYNPYAWLHGRIGTDLAPAGMQSYFNPLLDVFQAGLYRALPAPLVGFLLGWLQGLNAILLIAIGRRVLPSGTAARTVVGLAAAGCMAAGFLSELGNAMGDNLTALLVLGGFLLVLGSDGTHERRRLLAAGVLVGLATGLKLTNALYALGLGVTLLLVPARQGRRLLPALWLGVGGVAGLALTSGYWFWHLWQLFGNPLFPQFGSLWPNPLAAGTGVADLRFLPRTPWERLAWPLLIALEPSRVSEVPLPQLAWPVLYVLFLAWGACWAWHRWRAFESTPLPWPARCLASFVGLGFIIWMAVFSIYRYLVPIELLAPLLCWVLLRHLLPSRWPARVAVVVVAAIAVVGLGGYRHTWGHAGWADTAFRVEQPPLPPAALAHGTVLLVGTEPMAWRIPFLPGALAYVGIGTNFPAGPAYRPRVQAILRERGGEVWAMLPAADYPRGNYVAKLNDGAGWLGWNDDAAGCARLDRLRVRFRLRAALTATPGGGCRFTLREEDRVDLAPLDRATQAQALQALAPYRLRFAPAGCRRLGSWIGRSSVPYLWCKVAPVR
ncbi:glycosyltransferase 87 family protein [Frateuria sp. YIM B11624]|uniref:glycosyltransferase 87 family protein n=1 Tax=Frateuria sp. YIM B11624 TaxID=3143185 RepID=UPI003C75BC92